MKTLLTVIIASLVFGLTAIAKPTDNQKLSGVWLRELDNMRCTNIVAPDGSFTEHSVFVHPGRTNTYQMAGTWQIKDERFTESVTNDSNKAAVVPRSSNGQIVFVKTNEFVIHWQGSTNTQVWQKISP